jgi:O-antigen ligase
MWFIRILFGVLVAAIVLSQLVVAGRAGMLASFIGIAWIITGRGYRRWVPVFAGAAVAAAFLANDFLYKAMRLGDIAGHVSSVKDLNKFSAHRVESDIAAWKIFLESPIFGHGFHEITFGSSEIHNLWLRLAVEGGIFLPLGLAWIVWNIWSAARRIELIRELNAGNQLPTRCYQAVILMGVVMSLFEPRILLGAFQLYALWWATAGIAIGMLRTPTLKSRENYALPVPVGNLNAQLLTKRQA